jgi:pectate lyase
MKNFLLVCVLLWAVIFQLKAQNYLMTSPEGFGAGTTGGGQATPVIVNTYDELKTELMATDPAVVMVTGTITIPDGGYINAVIKNKTLLGLPGATLVNETQTPSGAGILYLKNGSTNVIIRNLIFVGPGAYDIDGRDNMTADGCDHLWVDHCEFQDGQDGNFDIKGKSDNVTVSWCKFTYLKPPVAGGSGGSNDHRFTNLVGSNKSDAPADGHFSVTFMDNYWADGCRERMPRARNAELHILNCYYNTTVAGSLAIGLGGGINNTTCYVEGTHFAQIGTVYKSYTSTDGGTVDINYENCLGGKSNIGIVPAPNYQISMMPVDQVADAVTNETFGAGANLQVNTAGEISIACQGTVYYHLATGFTGTGLGTVNVSPEGGSYEPGTVITLTATPNAQSTFDGWSGDFSGNTNPATVTLDANTTINAIFTLTTGIADQTEAPLSIYPGIIDEVFYIQVANDTYQELTVQLISITGKIVYTQQGKVDAETIEIKPGNLSNGIYFCRVQLGKSITTQKLIKQ